MVARGKIRIAHGFSLAVLINSRGKKVYDRRHVFQRIEADNGIHLKAKDLRDYFATEVANKVNDPATVMKLLRHTNMRTTSIYLRTVKSRMRDALKGFGATEKGQSATENTPVNPGGYSGERFDDNGLSQTAQNSITPEILAVAKLLVSQGLSLQRADGEKLLRTARDRAEPYRRGIVYPPQCSDNKYFVLCAR